MTLELGGKSPLVVCADADLTAAANGVVAGVFAATGQTCMAGSRLIVHEDAHDELVGLIAERAAAIRLGDPNDPDTEKLSIQCLNRQVNRNSLSLLEEEQSHQRCQIS